jgi:hypothetical protein
LSVNFSIPPIFAKQSFGGQCVTKQEFPHERNRVAQTTISETWIAGTAAGVRTLFWAIRGIRRLLADKQPSETPGYKLASLRDGAADATPMAKQHTRAFSV